VDVNSLSAIPQLLLERLDVAWTFVLLLTRHIMFMAIAPGVGGGFAGVVLRYPAAMVLSLAALNVERAVPMPTDMGGMTAQLISEVLLGAVIAMVPLLIVSGAQVAGHLASGTMGLNGAQLVDPTTQTSLPDMARIYSDLAIIIFLMVGGHYVTIYQLSGVESGIVPGTFILSSGGLQALVDQSAMIFQMGCMIAAPVIVALLLTNFVLAVISKAVPTVNIFIISFPLTIGVGLALSIVALPEVFHYLDGKFMNLEELLTKVVS
jgi:flagellar biosynthetic protein FliR